MWKIVIAVVITALICGGGVYVWHRSTVKKIADEKSKTEGQLQQQIDELQTELSKFQSERIQQPEKMLTSEVEDLKKELERKEEQLQNQPQLYDWYAKRFRERGLQDPISNIKSDLIKHKELIPYKGVLGGTMDFYYESMIHVLTAKWVLASFEDGHIGGEMLLEYQVLKNGTISWRVIDSYLDSTVNRQYSDE